MVEYPKLSQIAPYFQPDNQQAFIIAEVAQSHDGSLGQAHAFIDAVASTGVNAIKFQTHIATEESTLAEPFRVKFSRQDETRYDYWRRMEFSESQWQGLAEHAAEKGLIFLSSPFSIAAIKMLDHLDMPMWKVGSGEVSNSPQLATMIETGKPILLSSGLSSWEELECSVALIQQHRVPLVLFQATTAYPTPPEKLGLNLIQEYRQRFPGIPLGLSDHSATIYPSLAAYTLGVRFFEVHVTLSPYMFGPDVCASLTIERLQDMVSGLRFLERAMSNPVDKDLMAQELAPLRQTFFKSVVPVRDLPAGRILELGDLTLKKPGMGIQAADLPKLTGKRLKVAVTADEFFSWDQVE